MMHASLQSTLIFSGTFEGMQFGVCISEMSCDVTGSGSQVVLAQELWRSAKHSLWKPSRISATGPAHSVARPARQVPNLKNFSCSTFRLDLHLWQKAIAPDAAGLGASLSSLEALQVWAASVRGGKATRARHRETSETQVFLQNLSVCAAWKSFIYIELASKLLWVVT